MEKTESLEPQLTPDIKSDELETFIDQVEFESGNIYEFYGTIFNIIMFPEEGIDEDNCDAWYATSQIVPGRDIYILETLPLADKKHRLFHEVLELHLKDQGFSQEKAHTLAKEKDQKYNKINGRNHQ